MRVDFTKIEFKHRVLERPDMMAGYQNIFIAITLIVAMFMGCTFNAMNIISEKEDGAGTSGQHGPNLAPGAVPRRPAQIFPKKSEWRKGRWKLPSL